MSFAAKVVLGVVLGVFTLAALGIGGCVLVGGGIAWLGMKGSQSVAASRQMDAAVAVTINGVKVAAPGKEPAVDVLVQLQNTSSADVQGIAGTVFFRDASGTLVYSAPLAIDAKIAKGSFHKETVRLTLFEHDAGAAKLTALEKLTPSYFGKKVVFTDGTTIER